MYTKVLCKSAVFIKDLVSGVESHSYIYLVECNDNLLLKFDTGLCCKFSNNSFELIKNNIGNGEDFCLCINRREHLVIDRMLFMQVIQNFLSVITTNHLGCKFNNKEDLEALTFISIESAVGF